MMNCMNSSNLSFLQILILLMSQSYTFGFWSMKRPIEIQKSCSINHRFIRCLSQFDSNLGQAIPTRYLNQEANFNTMVFSANIMLVKSQLFGTRNQSLENHWFEEFVRNFDLSDPSNSLDGEILLQSFEGVQSFNPITVLSRFLTHIINMESEQITLYREVLMQRNEYSKFKLDILPVLFAPEIAYTALKSIDAVIKSLEIISIENAQSLKYTEMVINQGESIANINRVFLYQPLRKQLSSANDDVMNIEIFNMVSFYVTITAISRLRNELNPVTQLKELKFFEDFVEDISNARIIADLISSPSEQLQPVYQSFREAFNQYITQLGSPRHLLESLNVAAKKREMDSESQGQSSMPPTSLTNQPTINTERFPVLMREKEDYSGEDAADFSVADLYDAMAEDEYEDDDEDSSVDFVKTILGANPAGKTPPKNAARAEPFRFQGSRWRMPPESAALEVNVTEIASALMTHRSTVAAELLANSKGDADLIQSELLLVREAITFKLDSLSLNSSLRRSSSSTLGFMDSFRFEDTVQLTAKQVAALSAGFTIGGPPSEHLYRYILDPLSNNTLKSLERDAAEDDPEASSTFAGKPPSEGTSTDSSGAVGSEDTGPKGWRVMEADEDQTQTASEALRQKLVVSLLDPPMNWDPPQSSSLDDSNAKGGDEIIETRNPVDFGDIPFGDIRMFKELLAKGIDAVIRSVGRFEDVDDGEQYICLEAKLAEPYGVLRRWVRYNEAVEFMRGTTAEETVGWTEEGNNNYIFDGKDSPFFGGTIEPM